MTDTDILTTEDLVRSALKADESAYSDTDLSFPIDVAHTLVDRELLPYHGGSDDDLTNTETFLAAFYARDGSDGEGVVKSVKQNSRTVTFDTKRTGENVSTLWTAAVRQDPTGRLGELEKKTARIRVPDMRDGGRWGR